MSKTPTSKRNHHLPSPKHALPPQFEWIAAYGDDFSRVVEQPIARKQSFMKESQAQRCLAHNIVLSVYCTICRKVLCASCMYSTSQHRKHRVLPLSHAGDLLRQDVKAFAEKIPTVVQQCLEVGHWTAQHLLLLERDFSPLASRIQCFYEHLRTYIKMKEIQQLRMVRERKEEMKAEAVAFSQELDRVQRYISEKFKSYGNPHMAAEMLVPSRAILENLILASPFAKQPRFEGENLKVQLEEERVERIYEDVTYQINQLVPVFEKLIKNRTPQSARSEGEKRSVNYFRSAKKPDCKKQSNTSMAGVKTLKKT